MHQFLDGELPFESQADLFAHLAACERCRYTLDSVMRFRQMSRQEPLTVPPSLDEAFFSRLDRHKAAHRKLDRAADRRPLWQARTPVSLRAAVVGAVFVFIIGLLLPVQGTIEPAVPVEGLDEQVELPAFPEPQGDRPAREAVYVFYPGLTIEAVKLQEPPGADPL